MADSHVHHRSRYVWLWIILGIIVVIAVIWWASDTGTQPATAGAIQTTDNYDQNGVTNPAQPGTTEHTGPIDAGAAGSAAPAASPAPADAAATSNDAPAMSNSTTSPAT